MSCAATASTGTPPNVPRSPFARTSPSGNFSCAVAVTTTGAPGLRSRSMASGSRWCDGSSVTRIKSAGLACVRSPTLQGSTCTTVPACSTCTLACRIGVMTMSPPSAGTVFDDCAASEAPPASSAASTTTPSRCCLVMPPCYARCWGASTGIIRRSAGPYGSRPGARTRYRWDWPRHRPASGAASSRKRAPDSSRRRCAGPTPGAAGPRASPPVRR